MMFTETHTHTHTLSPSPSTSLPLSLLHTLQVKGSLTIHVTNPEFTKVLIHCDTGEKTVPFQTHPNIDKKGFNQAGTIGLKNKDRGFPVGTDVGILKWRFQTTDEAHIPLASALLLQCWQGTRRRAEENKEAI